MDRESAKLRMHWQPWLTGALGLLVSAAVAWGLARHEDRAIRSEVARNAAAQELAIRQHLASALTTVGTLESLLFALEDRSEATFRAAGRELLSRQPALRALSWNPRVRARERAAFEDRLEWDGASARARVWERSPLGQLVAAGSRPEYYPVAVIEPREANRQALGFDVGSETRRREALEQAAASSELTLTRAIELVQDPRRSPGLLAFYPVYDAAGGTPIPAGDRQDRLIGFVVGVFHIAEVVGEALAHFQTGELELVLQDVTVPEAPELLLARTSEAAGPPAAARTELRASRGSFARSSSFEIGGRRWELRLTPTAERLAGLRTSIPVGVLLAGVLLTIVLSLYLAGLLAARDRSEREVARRRRVEEELRQSEERLSLIVHAVTDDGGWDWDRETNDLYVSDAFVASLGYTRDEFASDARGWERLIHPEDLPWVTKSLDACVRGECDRLDIQFRIRTRSGEYRWLHNRAAVVARDDQGRAARIVGAQTDVTERRAAEEQRQLLELQLNHAQKLESLGVLAGGIAHDFNNLLTTVLGNAELGAKQVPEGAPGHAELQQIRLAATRAAELTAQMLSYAGKNRAVMEELDLSELVEEMVQLIRASISKKAELRLELAPDLPALQGDVAQLRQVVMNLLTNASDALGEESGVIHVRTDRCYVDELYLAQAGLLAEPSPGEHLLLEISDEGVGMAADVRERIFEPFFTTKFQGRGLGLAAVGGIVRRHGGALQVESAPGCGTTIRVLLPCPAHLRRQSAPAARAESAPWRGQGQVLVIDDEPAVRSLAERCLRRLGFEARSAVHGREGLELFRSQPASFRAVLLDLTMPVLDGEQTCTALREIQPDIPVVLCSGYAQPDSLACCQDQRSGFLQKPYTLEQLAAALRAVLPREESEGETAPSSR